MAVTTTNAFDGPFAGDGVTDEFTYTFDVPEAVSDAEVVPVLRSAAGVDTVQTLGVHYTHSWALKKITMVTPPAAGESITINRATPVTQPATLSASSGWSPAADQQRIDKVVRSVQELWSRASRTPTLPSTLGLTAGYPRSLLSTQIGAASASLVFQRTRGFGSYEMEFSGLACSGNGIAVELSNDGGATYPNGLGLAFQYLVRTHRGASDLAANAAGAASGLLFNVAQLGNVSGSVRFHFPVSGSSISTWVGDLVGIDGGTSLVNRSLCSGFVQVTGGDYTHLRLIPTSGTLTGTVRLWGWPTS